ncbi:MAG: MurR/RpiR family transcriptional regulator [Rhizobiales bacterium]|nr:MurR/RpiR family transcriptional regulator [Hyphomicrobiales bacterium]MBI3674967.1 MurR/RpiR family transcriptional regulator [Hyphomicrobiales bacterium]
MRQPVQTTIAERLRLKAAELTAAERKLMATLFANYPMAGLASITEFAREACVSTPSVLRLAKKLGFSGFPAFQERLRAELSAQLQNPIAKHDRWSADAPDTHILNRFATAAMENLSGSLKLMDHRSFDAVVALLTDRRRRIHIGGGRITGALAVYLTTHLQMARPEVTLVPAMPAMWPQVLLDIGKKDVVVVFDIRRYDARMLEFAASARERGAKLVLITDQWISPIARLAVHSLPLRIEAPSSWDSNIVLLFMAEALVAAIINAAWPETQARIRELEGLAESVRRPR